MVAALPPTSTSSQRVIPGYVPAAVAATLPAADALPVWPTEEDIKPNMVKLEGLDILRFADYL